MFETFKKLLDNRRYFPAGDIFSTLGMMTRMPPEYAPEGFYNAQVNVVPMDDCLHIFIVFENVDDFNAMPGDMAEVEYRGPIRLVTKAVQLSELFAPQFSRGVLLHFMHTAEVTRLHLVSDPEGVTHVHA